jgi:hypothetical protein
MITVVRRLSDGLLADIQQGPGLPTDTGPRIQNAINKFGGVADDWAAYEVPSELWANINPAARQFATLADGAISSISQSTPPAAVLSAATVEADGVAEITLTVTIPDYNGPVKLGIYPPLGEPSITTLTAINGEASEAISTEYEGGHQVMIETELAGVTWLEFTGV